MITPRSHPDDHDHPKDSKEKQSQWCLQDYHCPGCVYEFYYRHEVPNAATHCHRCNGEFSK